MSTEIMYGLQHVRGLLRSAAIELAVIHSFFHASCHVLKKPVGLCYLLSLLMSHLGEL